MQPNTLEGIAQLVSLMVRVGDAVRKDTEAVLATNDHVDIIRHYDSLRKVTEQIKLAREALNDIEENLSREKIPGVLRAMNIKTISIVDVGRVTVSHRYSCSLIDKDKGYKWLIENGHGGIITQTVNSSTLSGFAKSYLEDEGKELPDDLFKVSSSPYTSITKIK